MGIWRWFMRVGKHAPPAEPLPPALAVQVRQQRDETVARLVARAETAEAAWETFQEDEPMGGQTDARPVVGPTPEKARAARAEALLQAVHALGVQVKAGQRLVMEQEGGPLPLTWVNRFKELHTKRLHLRWQADAATFRYADWEHEAERILELTDDETRKVLGELWPDEAVQRLMNRVGVVGAWDREALRGVCLLQIIAAVE